MNFFGLMLGAFMLLMIGAGHVMIIKGEYRFGTRLWVVFLVIALCTLIASLLVESKLVSGILAIAGFTFLWSIHEIFKQKGRVEKGWFPKNPGRKA